MAFLKGLWNAGSWMLSKLLYLLSPLDGTGGGGSPS